MMAAEPQLAELVCFVVHPTFSFYYSVTLLFPEAFPTFSSYYSVTLLFPEVLLNSPLSFVPIARLDTSGLGPISCSRSRYLEAVQFLLDFELSTARTVPVIREKDPDVERGNGKCWSFVERFEPLLTIFFVATLPKWDNECHFGCQRTFSVKRGPSTPRLG